MIISSHEIRIHTQTHKQDREAQEAEGIERHRSLVVMTQDTEAQGIDTPSQSNKIRHQNQIAAPSQSDRLLSYENIAVSVPGEVTPF